MLINRATGRDPAEAHRVSTTLELFFDLVFVVAIAMAASSLHHDIVEDRIRHGLISYLLVFFAIWVAWINFTWFASAFDTSDLPYKLLVFVQMTGALILAAGVPEAFEDRQFGIVIVGYVVMRLALVAQWLRVAWQAPIYRSTALRYAIGTTIAQIGWVAWLVSDLNDALWVFILLAVLELAVPFWAESARATPWHPEHIQERYGLFTIIVLGECVLAASLAVQTIDDLSAISRDLVGIVIGGLLTLYSLWWLSFWLRGEQETESLRSAFIWGYGHYVIWAATAASGVGISVAVDYATAHSVVSERVTGAALAVPVAIILLTLWALQYRPGQQSERFTWLTPVAALIILITPITSVATLLTGVVLTVLCALRTAFRPAAHHNHPA